MADGDGAPRGADWRPEFETLAWFALTVRPGCEETIKDRVGSFGTPVAVPRKIVYRRPHRHAKAKRPVVRPLITGYVFAAIDHEWAPVLSLPNVVGVLGSNGAPKPVSAREFSFLMRRSSAGAFTAPSHWQHLRTGREFCVGDSVEILAGPLAGYVVQVSSLKGESAKVALTLFGDCREAEIPLDHLAAA
ncbi:MAG: transcription termination/antitermination NusG family protein [Pseudomonadota bacterium]